MEKAELQMSITLNAFNNLGQSCKDILTQFYFYKAPLRTIAENLGIEEAAYYAALAKIKEGKIEEAKNLLKNTPSIQNTKLLRQLEKE